MPLYSRLPTLYLEAELSSKDYQSYLKIKTPCEPPTASAQVRRAYILTCSHLEQCQRHCTITTMLFSASFLPNACLFFLSLHLSQASPVPEPTPSPGPDQKPTVWSHATVDTMKAQRQTLYEYALAMYNHQDYFEDPLHCVSPPVPDVKYLKGNRCPRANLVSRRECYAWFK